MHGTDPVEQSLRRVISERLISIAFQPIVGLDQASIIAYEALTRPKPESGFRTPDELFDAAERAGLTWEIEELARSLALERAASWPGGTQLFLNCSPDVVGDDRFVDAMLDGVASYPGLSASRIVLEVTERSESHHIDRLQRQTAALQKHGFRIAIDDVGAGTSGLNRIMLLRPQWLKMDRALITDIDQDPVRTNLIRFLTHFSRLSGVSIIAEGIERTEELDRLLQLGVDAVQGYLLGRPGTDDQVLDPELVSRIAERQSHKTCSVFHRDRADTVISVALPVLRARDVDPVSFVRGSLEADSRLQGIIVSRNGGETGWCPREKALLADDDITLADLAGPFRHPIAGDERIDAALEILATIDDADLDAPIALTERGAVVGAARVRDILRAGSEVCRVVRQRSATLTGLPGRVRCEQQLLRAIREDAKRDAVFIDIRNLSEYNAVFGFDLGDQLITSLVEVIGEATRELVGLDSDGAFLGHLGDDRLMLIADAGLARRIALPAIGLFESRVTASGISPQVALAGVGDAPAVPGVSLRYLLVPAVNEGYTSPQDVLQLEPILRQMADERAAVDPTRSGYIVEVPHDGRGEPYLLAA